MLVPFVSAYHHDTHDHGTIAQGMGRCANVIYCTIRYCIKRRGARACELHNQQRKVKEIRTYHSIERLPARSKNDARRIKH